MRLRGNAGKRQTQGGGGQQQEAREDWVSSGGGKQAQRTLGRAAHVAHNMRGRERGLLGGMPATGRQQVLGWTQTTQHNNVLAGTYRLCSFAG